MLRAKTAVVTGVTSGIGEALTQRLLDAGASVVGIGRDGARLSALSARWGSAFRPIVMDLAAADERARAIERMVAEIARVDVLVNNAAECVYELPSTLPIARWRALLEVNLLAGIELAQQLAPRMGGDGHVVNLSSVSARFLPNARFAPYALTKAALEQFTAALRLELDPAGIKVTLIAPGLVDTPIYDKVAGFERARAKAREQVPEWLRADDVAEAVLWALTRPAHVAVSAIEILPRAQGR